MATMEIDVDEVKDRVDLLKDTVQWLSIDQPEIEHLKISISSFCIEKAKILALIYKFRTVRYIRENMNVMSDLDIIEEDLEKLNQ